MKKGLTEKELRVLLEKWKQKLLLDDWGLSIEFVEFTRKDYKQSGDIKVYPRKKKAVVLLTNDPFRDEESVLVHELVHLVLWDYDIFNEKLALSASQAKLKGMHKRYMNKLEATVDHITKVFLKK